MDNWSIEDSSDLYNLQRWGNGFFDINQHGQLVARLQSGSEPVSILESINKAAQRGFNAPYIVRFPEIIRHRVRQLNHAFGAAIEEMEYGGRYRFFYPAKVNQHRDVLSTAIEAAKEFGGGVEAGSKAELFAALMMTDHGVQILCNGFKDKTILEMALRATQIGRNVTIILENPSELELLIQSVDRIGVRPNLGVRVKLAARSGGRWNASGGAKSKFGLTTTQLVNVVARLRDVGLADCLDLLHFHPGSQISNIRKIKTSIVEAARIYADLVNNDVPIRTIDVGGGLAVDYTGERNTDPSSKNYSLEEYANDIVFYIKQVCQDAKVPEPDIISESGRAVTAHHSMLVVPILENEDASKSVTSFDESICESSYVLSELKIILESLNLGNLSECFHDAQESMVTVWQMFSLGSLSIKQRSCAESMVSVIYRKIASMLGGLDFVPNELENLRHQLAETYIANFSLFQALPDSWALNQVFPVVPIHRLDERATKRAVIGDITCDSDGKIDCFIGARGGKNSLALHESNGQPYFIGVFLIGAYQEALSDDHNLMGRFHVMSVLADGTVEMRPGAETIEVLEHVYHDRKELTVSLNECIDSAFQESRISDNERENIRLFFQSVMSSYTYLDPTASTVGQHEVGDREKESLSSS